MFRGYLVLYLRTGSIFYMGWFSVGWIGLKVVTWCFRFLSLVLKAIDYLLVDIVHIVNLNNARSLAVGVRRPFGLKPFCPVRGEVLQEVQWVVLFCLVCWAQRGHFSRKTERYQTFRESPRGGTVTKPRRQRYRELFVNGAFQGPEPSLWICILEH